MFNIDRLNNNRVKRQALIDSSPFYEFICADLIDRLKPIDRQFAEVMLISPPCEERFHSALSGLYPACNIVSKNIKDIDQSNNRKFDLVVFSMGLHWVSDVQSFLKLVRGSLLENGIFICNFTGGGSLGNLRRKLIEVESNFACKHSMHISPFIQFEHMTPLLQQAGFTENIIDMEAVELEYDSALLLMKAIQSAGESNSLVNGVTYSITKDMYYELQRKRDTHFTDTINLITFISSPTRQSIKLRKEHFNAEKI
ncbi:MAG: methyltransferase domain-containing protein [Rickettsiaceae bacterium]